jgi:hypothetical protein
LVFIYYWVAKGIFRKEKEDFTQRRKDSPRRQAASSSSISLRLCENLAALREKSKSKI